MENLCTWPPCGGQRVVIYFYPKDATPGCTKEACNFRDRWSSFKDHGIHVLGISKDNAASHTRFIAKQELPFTLLSDAEPCPVASSFESYGLKKFMGRESMGNDETHLRHRCRRTVGIDLQKSEI
jgi:peroxiredoxin Q/BCP